MTPQDFHTSIQNPGLLWTTSILGPVLPMTPAIQILMLASAGVESDWQNIPQANNGPGRGPWQFEPETCSEIVYNKTTAVMADKICQAVFGKGWKESEIYPGLLVRPNLAVAFARLDYWANPRPLPDEDDKLGQYQYYVETWEPGKPNQARWNELWPLARAVIKGASVK